MCRSRGYRRPRHACGCVLTVAVEGRAGRPRQSCHGMAPGYGTALQHGATSRCSECQRHQRAPRALRTLLLGSGQLAAALRSGCPQEGSFRVLRPEQTAAAHPIARAAVATTVTVLGPSSGTGIRASSSSQPDDLGASRGPGAGCGTVQPQPPWGQQIPWESCGRAPKLVFYLCLL